MAWEAPALLPRERQSCSASARLLVLHCGHMLHSLAKITRLPARDLARDAARACKLTSELHARRKMCEAGGVSIRLSV